jgi:hypothetical protein
MSGIASPSTLVEVLEHALAHGAQCAPKPDVGLVAGLQRHHLIVRDLLEALLLGETDVSRLVELRQFPHLGRVRKEVWERPLQVRDQHAELYAPVPTRLNCPKRAGVARLLQ